MYVCMYVCMYVYLHVHCTRPCTLYASPITSAIVHFNTCCCSEHHFEESPSLGMADGASTADDSLDNDSDLGRTCTATEHKKCSRQTAAQREERLSVERVQHIPFFITSSYYTALAIYIF